MRYLRRSHGPAFSDVYSCALCPHIPYENLCEVVGTWYLFIKSTQLWFTVNALEACYVCYLERWRSLPTTECTPHSNIQTYIHTDRQRGRQADRQTGIYEQVPKGAPILLHNFIVYFFQKEKLNFKILKKCRVFFIYKEIHKIKLLRFVERAF